ncbi:MAG: dTMP kinase, partial [Burkholderiaceae bacterium]|nr:dTMP kinase [Burkholderiaceae bacterium]
FEAVRNGYARRAAADPARFARIDANQPREAVWAAVCAAVQGRGWL